MNNANGSRCHAELIGSDLTEDCLHALPDRGGTDMNDDLPLPIDLGPGTFTRAGCAAFDKAGNAQPMATASDELPL